MKTRITLAAVAVAAGAALLLAGCSGTSDTGSGEHVTLKWWGWNASEYQKTIDQFEKANPDIEVDFTTYSNADYTNNLRAALTSGKGPDVLQLSPGALTTNYAPLVEDLGPLAKKEWGDDWKSTFNPLGLSQLAVDGKQAAMPSYMSAAGFIYYNSDILKKAGVSVPTDIDQWKQSCQAIKAAGYDCLAHGAKDAWVNEDVYLALINSIAPGEVYKAIDGKTSWTGADFVKAMSAWKSLFTDGIIPAGATAVAEYPDAFSSFIEGKAAFVALGTWNTPGTMTKTGLAVSQKSVTNPADAVFLSAPFPGAAAGVSPSPAFGGPDNGWAISSNSAHKDAAWKFMAFLAGEKGQTIQASVANFPALNSVPVSTSDVVAPEQADNITQQQKALSSLAGYRQIPYTELEAALGQALSEVAAGTQTPQAALQAVEDASKAVKR